MATPQLSGQGSAAQPPASTGGGNVVASGGDDFGSGNLPKPDPDRQGPPPLDQLVGRPIGRILRKLGRVTREQVVEGLQVQKTHGGLLGDILVKRGYIKERDIQVALAAQKGNADAFYAALKDSALPSLEGLTLGRILREMRNLTAEQILTALDHQRERGGKLGQILIGMNLITDDDLKAALAKQRNL